MTDEKKKTTSQVENCAVVRETLVPLALLSGSSDIVGGVVIDHAEHRR